MADEERQEEEKEPAFEITVPVYDLSGRLILKESLGKGSYGEIEFQLMRSLPMSSPMIEVDDKVLVVNINDIAKAVLAEVYTEDDPGG